MYHAGQGSEAPSPIGDPDMTFEEGWEVFAGILDIMQSEFE